MPRPGEYTRAKRNAMQATMFVILLCSVGLAALVDKRIVSAAVPALGAEWSNGPLHLRLPAYWIVLPEPEMDDGVVAEAIDRRSPRGNQRSIKIFRQSLKQDMTPDEYLAWAGISTDVFGDANQANQEVDHITVAGAPALRIHGEVPYESIDGKWVQSETLVCAVYPNRQAVTLWLSDRSDDTDADQELLDEVVGSVSMH
jgi:hypothetical protein